MIFLYMFLSNRKLTTLCLNLITSFFDNISPLMSVYLLLHNYSDQTHREETARPISQLSSYNEQRSYKRNMEEKTETRAGGTTYPSFFISTIPATTRIYSSDSNKNYTASDVFNRKEDMSETLPLGSISNTHANTQGGYRDQHGHDVSYKREMQTAVDPGKEYALLKEEEKRVVETDLEPGVISRLAQRDL
uniref:Uncharacterized protein n=1 Tax=Angiostrongylus cantonensis TaxID=6313 RepID=A0A0K0CYN3_ANGCA